MPTLKRVLLMSTSCLLLAIDAECLSRLFWDQDISSSSSFSVYYRHQTVKDNRVISSSLFTK